MWSKRSMSTTSSLSSVRRMLISLRKSLPRCISVKKSVASIILVMLASVVVRTPQATAKPTFNFAIPGGFSLARFVDVGDHLGIQKRSIPQVKPYTGLRITNNSLIMIYYCDQTVAIAELGKNKLLLSCELIEVHNDEDRSKLLEELSKMNKPLEITFPDMVKLMLQCQQVDTLDNQRPPGSRPTKKFRRMQSSRKSRNKGYFDNSPLSLLSGIIPGTKWCGTGDIADNYHDLGPEAPMDRCCRTHDLCPVKVRAFSKKYNLTNTSIYSKSHCICDDELFTCLKATNTSASQVMGSIYFNIVKVECVEENNGGRQFRGPRDGF